ncbi:MAG: CcmD family protein [Ignavibacteriales bacterium]|jgi:CcmD family protein|nr:CcmD family protein [Ignavibacteriales bacterium]MBP7542567.1 CcmD family protein [Ignavibacteriaceae bacterium]MBK7265875.1 CcmD family protein [Ignavibacteriales bacterium]MBK8663748.1 CcmD family protein [Ignavibacteriales bacterium]MBP9122907.1 CcmD family protein [Ignavibacteriaceae bacterium]
MEFLEKNAIYIVLIIVMLTWSGIFTYLFTLDKRLKELKKEVEEK